METAEALRKFRLRADLLAKGVLCAAEFASAFLCEVMEVPLAATDECLATLPPPALPVVLEMLTEFAGRDYHDDRHAYIMDGRTPEQRREYFRQMQPHYRLIGERLLARLQATQEAEPDVAGDQGPQPS